MNVTLEPGMYVVAVSGGVDSMVLLHLLHQQPKLQLVVAHFDHGIRVDSAEDRLLVERIAKKMGLQFFYAEGKLGAKAGEAQARQARYDFLNQIKKTLGAQAIVTAHHQDDVLETAVINLLRGTGRRGLTSLKSNNVLVRPLLQFNKSDLLAYAQDHQIVWREDSTNSEEKYLRNYVRKQILTKFTDEQRQSLIATIESTQLLNNEIDQQLTNLLQQQPDADKINRQSFINLPHNIALDVLASWLRGHNIPYDSKALERLVVAAKTYRSGKQASITNDFVLVVKNDYLALKPFVR